MNILIYAPTIGRESGGIYQYTLNLINTLSKDKDNTYFLYNFTNDSNINNFISTSNNFFLINSIKYKEHILSHKINSLIYLINKQLSGLNVPFTLKFKTKLDRLCKKFKINIIHCPYQYLPFSKVKTISTMHDVQELHFPEFFSSELRALRAFDYKRTIDGAKKIIVSYKHIKEDIIKYFNKPEQDIEVILLDMKNLWFDNYTLNDISPLTKYGKFILYPAATWEHKNHKRLIEAFNLLKKDLKDISLVCTGNKTNYYFKELEPLIEQFGLENNIYFEGIVEDKYLFNLYHNCDGVVIPTLYEAGSFPLMESMLLGVPVICSNVTSLPDTIEDQRFIFNPYDVTDIRNKMELLISDDKYKQMNKDNSNISSIKFRNNNALEKIKNIYKILNT